MSRDDMPEPCTTEADEQGCTCSMHYAGFYSFNPPEPHIDRNCPLHGEDPDDARDRALNRRERNAGLTYED